MDKYSRPAPGAASPSSPSMNPNRTNNSREASSGHSRMGSEVPTYSEIDDSLRGDSVVVTGPSYETKRKLDQIIQNLFTKAAIVILQSRISVPVITTKDGPKSNKWFQLETFDTDTFREELRPYRNCGAFENRPVTMVFEVSLDMSEMSSSQSLVLVDESGRQHDCTEAWNDVRNAQSGKRKYTPNRIVLERWTIKLKDAVLDSSYDYGSQLPSVYKRAIITFRGLLTTCQLLPAARFKKALEKNSTTNNKKLKLSCGILRNDDEGDWADGLTCPLFDGADDVCSVFNSGDTETPAGAFSVEVMYRNDCNFKIEQSEKLMSEKFMGDADVFKPTLGTRDRRRESQTETTATPSRRYSGEIRGTQTYGSMSTFHGEAPPLGSSPMSALRAARAMGDAADSPPVGSLPSRRPTYPQRPASIALDNIAAARKNSLTGPAPFNLFKAGSLSGIPAPGTSAPQGSTLPPGSPHSLSRPSSLSHARNRSSLTAGMPSTLRGGAGVLPTPSSQASPNSATSSPRPAGNRFSSSFSHRRGRLSYGGTSRADEEGRSSGNQSLSSSVQHGSGVIPGTGGSSGSLPTAQTDDDNISDFLKALELNKNLPSLQKQNSGEVNKRAIGQLNRFQNMRESHNVLTESISNSMLLQRSSSTSSKQLSSVPPLVGGASLSMSSSPGKAISPHTPHTPIVPSRLSANSVADYPTHVPSRRYRSRTTPADEPAASSPADDAAAQETTSTAAPIEIPISPRPRPHQYRDRRSSSVIQQQRTAMRVAEEDDIGGFHRSISLGAGDREPPSLSDLRGFGAEPVSGSGGKAEVPADSAVAGDEGASVGSGPIVSPAVQRVQETSSRGGLGARTGSSSSLGDRANRYSWTRPPPVMDDEGEGETDEYPLLFDMSELGRNSEGGRRSLEEGRGGGTAGAGSGRGGRL